MTISGRQPVTQIFVLFACFMALLVILLSGRSTPKPVITVHNARDVNLMVRLGNGQIFSMAWSPDGNVIAGAGSIGVWIYDANNLGTPPSLIEGHSGFVRDVAFHPDGHLLASASADHTVRLWDTKTWTQQAVFEGHTGEVLAATFSPDGRWLASAANDASVRLWDVAARTEKAVLRHSADCVFGLSFHPQRPLLASIGQDGIRLWNVETGEQVAGDPTGYRDCGRNRIAFSAGGMILLAGESRSYASAWMVDDAFRMTPVVVEESRLNMPALIYISDFYSSLYMGVSANHADEKALGAMIFEIQNRSSARDQYLTYSPDGTQIAANSDKSWDLWEVENRTKIAILHHNLYGIYHLALSPRNNAVLATDSLSTALWTLPHPITETIREGYGGIFYTVAFDRANRPLAAYTFERATSLLNVATGEEVTRLRGLQGRMSTLEFSPNSRLIAANVIGITGIWEVMTGEQIAYMPFGYGSDITFSPDSTLLATLDFDHGYAVTLWEILNNTSLTGLRGLGESVGSFTLSNDHRLLAAVAGNEAIRLWDTENASDAGAFFPSRTLVWQTQLVFSPDDLMFAAISGNGDVWLWEIATLEERMAHLNSLLPSTSNWRTSSAAFSSDSSLLAVGTQGGDILFNDTATGERVHVLSGHTGCISHLIFNREGTLLVSGSCDGTVRLWRIGPTIQPPAAHVMPVNIPGADFLLTPTEGPVAPVIPTMPAWYGQ